MRLTIIPSDNAVYVDGVAHELDVTTAGIPTDVHALQWYDTRGWIEFTDVDPFTPKPANQEISELPQWANACVTVWNAWTPPVVNDTLPAQPSTSGLQTL